MHIYCILVQYILWKLFPSVFFLLFSNMTPVGDLQTKIYI